LLLVDLKDSFGTLGLQNSNVEKTAFRSLDPVALSALWNTPLHTVEAAPFHKNSFVRALDDAYEQLTVGLEAPIAKKQKELDEIGAQMALLGSTTQATTTASRLHTLDELKQKQEELQTDINRMKKRQLGDKIEADEEREKNTFADLDESVHYWSDYLKTYVAPRSLFEFKAYSIDDKFDAFPMGHQLMRNEEDREDVESRVHVLLEDCDHVQGVQMMVDVDNGFGAIGMFFFPLLVLFLGLLFYFIFLMTWTSVVFWLIFSTLLFFLLIVPSHC
jgi:hypothetical protein